jgi:(R)-2-hydroxyacyl-CoA dehydratese activating ATPase
MNMHYMGIDIGSSYTKITVIDEEENCCYREVAKTLNRNKETLADILKTVHEQYSIASVCATGYGREHIKEAHENKTEISCASEGMTKLFPAEKNIIDIGGEDIKVIWSGADGRVRDFYMNTKCAAGTGTFITEIAERAEIDLARMSELASGSDFDKELNSFCTVFAKTEIMKWVLEDVPVHDLARGIYISIANRIARIRQQKDLPVYLIGGVIHYHPFLRNILEEKFKCAVTVPPAPQYINSLGAALLAKKRVKQNEKAMT